MAERLIGRTVVPDDKLPGAWLGDVTRFQDFIQTTAPQGALKSQTTPGGQTLIVVGYTGQNIAEVQRAATIGGVTTVESLLYTYAGGDLQAVTLRRQVGGGAWTNIRQASYTYYGGGDANGSTGDLQTATIQVWNGSSWQNQKVCYYRYWIGSSSSSSSSSTGPYAAAHLLKYVVNPGSYSRMTAAGSGLNPLTATDAQLAQYADMYFEYDASRRATKEVLTGGKYVYTYAFTPAAFSSSSSTTGSIDNNWSIKTVETRPDGATLTVYTNEIGQVLLRKLGQGATSWIDCQQFDASANLSLHAFPSAVAGFDDTQPNLGISFNVNSGLIETFAYFGGASSSSSSSAGVAPPDGYLQAEYVQQGSTGAPIKLRDFQYGTQSAGGATIFPVTGITAYRNDDGTGAVATGYAYTYIPGTVAVQQRSTTYPVVPAAQNGSGVAATRQEYLDAWGNLIWEMGPRGFIMYQAFDVPTGGLLQRIDDFNTSLPGQPTPPSGWSTPAGGGLNLITTSQVDNLGRNTEELGPPHTVDLGGVATTVRTATWTVYQDYAQSGQASEVWMAEGYATGTAPNYTYTLVDPVSITRTDDDGQVTDQISAIRSNKSGPLSPSDTFAQSSYCRWTNNVYSGAGELTATRVYFAIPSTGPGVKGTNYNETDVAQDGMGRQNRVQSPGLTITRTVFDPRSLPLSIWMGTNDTGATDADPTGGGAPGNNMAAVQINQYDGGTAGGDGNLTLLTLPVDGNAANNRNTAMQYDWRNRQVQVNAAQDWYLVNTFDTMNRVTQVDRHAQGGGTLIGRAQTFFDDRGDIYQTALYAIDPSTTSPRHLCGPLSRRHRPPASRGRLRHERRRAADPLGHDSRAKRHRAGDRHRL